MAESEEARASPGYSQGKGGQNKFNGNSPSRPASTEKTDTLSWFRRRALDGEKGPLPGRQGNSVTMRSLAQSGGGSSVCRVVSQFWSAMSSSSGSTPIWRR